MAPTAALTFTALPTSTSASPYALITPFTAPAQCAQSVAGMTMLQSDGFHIWLNAMIPVPGTTITSCYPSEFASSFLAQTAGISQSAFSLLVCLVGYTTQAPYTSSYIACCPSGWDGLATVSDAPSDRPAAGGTCYTGIFNKPIQITSYDNSVVQGSSLFTASGTADRAFAYPYEGFVASIMLDTSATSTTSTLPITSSQPTSISTSTPTNPIAITTNNKSVLVLHNKAYLAVIIVGSIVAAIFFAALGLFVYGYRRRKVQEIDARTKKRRTGMMRGRGHKRLRTDTPTSMMPCGMMYLSQPPKVFTDWDGERRSRTSRISRVSSAPMSNVGAIVEQDLSKRSSSAVVLEVKLHVASDPQESPGVVSTAETHEEEKEIRAERWTTYGSTLSSELGVDDFESIHREDREEVLIEGGREITDETAMEEEIMTPRQKSIYELNAAVDAMMEDMVVMMRSKRLPDLPMWKQEGE